MKRLTAVDESGDSLFRNAHLFYHDALKPGPQLDAQVPALSPARA
jgi:hypothetical protein